MDDSRFLARTAVGIMMAALAGCGGGGDGGNGGGDPTPIVYDGSTSQATVTTTNASKLASNVIASGDSAAAILAVTTKSGDATQDLSSGIVGVARVLSRTLRDTALRAEQASASPQAVNGALVDGVCDSGSIGTTGKLNSDGTGTVTVRFDNCVTDGVSLSGPATLRVDHFEMAMDMPTDFTLTFVRLVLRGATLSVDATGSLRWVFTGSACCGVGVTFEGYAITANLVSLNNSTSKKLMTENLLLMNEERLTATSTSLTSVVTGRVFDQDFGYVDISTPTPIVFGTLTQPFPDSGQLLLTAAAGSTIRATAVSSTMVQLELDLDGVGGVDNTAMLRWTDLTGPIGADLGDSDADGMHNSWEAFYGPTNTTDDVDLDGFDSLAEYMAGTNPNDINSHP